MKKYNIGLLENFTNVKGLIQVTPNSIKGHTTAYVTNTYTRLKNNNQLLFGLASSSENYELIEATIILKETNELWLYQNIVNTEEANTFYIKAYPSSVALPYVQVDCRSTTINFTIMSADGNSILYEPKGSIQFSNDTWSNIEIHYKTGENGRIDIWWNHSLVLSFRSPSAFNGQSLEGLIINRPSSAWAHFFIGASIISDEGRIGYEKFQKLTIDPDTEQNIELGQSTQYTLSGVTIPEASVYTEITGVHTIVQPTSKDANILSADLALDGTALGKADVSDASGNAYEMVTSRTKNGAAWTADDIEGKTLTLTTSSEAVPIEEGSDEES